MHVWKGTKMETEVDSSFFYKSYFRNIKSEKKLWRRRSEILRFFFFRKVNGFTMSLPDMATITG